MDCGYTSWCREHFHLSPKQFLKAFNRDYQPSSQSLVDFACFIFKNMPQNQNSIEIQDLIWGKIEDLKIFVWANAKLTEEAAYKAFENRRKINEQHIQEKFNLQKKDPTILHFGQKDPLAYTEVAPLEPKKLWETYFPAQTIEEMCLLILKEVPLDDLTFEDVILNLIYSLVINLEPHEQKNQIAREFAAKLIASIRLSHDQLRIDTSGQKIQSDDLYEIARKTTLEMSVRLRQTCERLVFSRNSSQNDTLRKALHDLCSLLNFIFSNMNRVEVLEQPITFFYSEETKQKKSSFSRNLSTFYVQSSLNAALFFRKIYGSGQITRALDRCEKELIFLFASIDNIKKEDHLPSSLMKWHQKKLKITRTILKELEIILDEEKNHHNWLFINCPSYEYAAVTALLVHPLFCLDKNLTSGLTHSMKMSKEKRLLLLPDSERLVSNLKSLYENRIIIAGYLDYFRSSNFELIKLALATNEKKGSYLQETISEFSTSLTRVELSHLITVLKPTQDLEKVSDGEILTGINRTKMALNDYLYTLIQKSIGDAEEVIIAVELMLNFCHEIPGKMTMYTDFQSMYHEIVICSKNTRRFLETVAWLQTYFKKQQPVWNEEICKPPEKKEKKKDLKKNKGEKKKQPKRKPATEPAAPPVVSAAVNTPPAAVKATQPSAATLKKPSKPSATELWKAEVARIRTLRDTTKRLKRLQEARSNQQPELQEDLNSLENLLEGSLRRRSPEEVDFLAGKKIKNILAILEEEGWKESHITGDHHILKHTSLRGIVVIPYTSKADRIDRGTFQSIAKAAGWVD